MKNIKFIIIMMMSSWLSAQNLGTDVEGFSTIYTQGSSLSFDTTNDQLMFDYFDKSEFKFDTKNEVYKSNFKGISLMGTANDGVSNLFSSGKFNAETGINIVYGWRRSKNERSSKDLLEIEKLKSEKYEYDAKIGVKYKEVLASIKDLKKRYISNELNNLLNANLGTLTNADIQPIITNINRADSASDWSNIETQILGLKNKLGEELIPKIKSFDETAKMAKGNGKTSVWRTIKSDLTNKIGISQVNRALFINEIDAIVKLNEEEGKIATKLQKMDEDISSLVTTKWLFKLGITGQEFKYDLDNGADTAKERFSDEEFTGLNFEFIYNLQFKYYNFFGFSLKAERANNFNTLESKEISLAEMVAEGETGSEETVNAFVGDYDTFNRYSFNADYMRLIPLESDGKDYIYLSINPYLRHFIYENAKELKNSTNLGIGFNFFNSTKNKVLGGAFIQANDIFGVQSQEAIGKSIAFGLVLRYAFKGFDFKETAD